MGDAENARTLGVLCKTAREARKCFVRMEVMKIRMEVSAIKIIHKWQ